jgi:hypothetical protein
MEQRMMTFLDLAWIAFSAVACLLTYTCGYASGIRDERKRQDENRRWNEFERWLNTQRPSHMHDRGNDKPEGLSIKDYPPRLVGK